MPLLEVIRGAGTGAGNGSAAAAMLTSQRMQAVADFYQALVLDGRGFQVRAGTITAPLTGDVAITDTAAEMAADAASGTTIIPFEFAAHFESLNGGTLPEVAAKSVATASSGGTAFEPLPLKTNGSAAVSTARVQAAGSVTVTAELATTTLRHFSALVATVGTGNNWFEWNPKAAPILVGARCFYVQVAGVTAGPLYFAHFNYLEVPTALIDPS